MRRIVYACAAAAILWSGAAGAQLRYTVSSPERCEPVSQQIVKQVLYYRKLRVQQDNWDKISHRVRPSANQALADLDRWAPGEQRRLARLCLGSRPTRERPWLYEWAEPRR